MNHFFSQKQDFLVDNIEQLYVIKKNYPGALSHLSELFKENRINMRKIESTLLNRNFKYQNVMFNITLEGNRQDIKVQTLFQELKERFDTVEWIDEYEEVPWFPRNIKDLQSLGQTLLVPNDSNNNEHKQFKDPEYRKRRDYIADIAKSHNAGEPIQIVDYTQKENQTWNYIYDKLNPYIKSIFSQRFKYNMEKLERNCGLNGKNIPQLKDLDEFLQAETGFRIKPVHGLLSQREFLNAFAHKVFCCTQYIRHHETPEYTPEPDIIHEIIGHVPMFCDPEFVQLSQEIGLASLGASDQEITKMGALYWYTVEFGSIIEDGEVKPYGAGIASSIGECSHFKSKQANFQHLNPFQNLITDYPVQKVQDIYYYNNSFPEAINMILKYSKTFKKPMKCYYDERIKEVLCDQKVKSVGSLDKLDQGPLF